MAIEMRNFIQSLTLVQRFMLASLVILMAGMLGIGAWVGRQIETGVINRSGATAALYVDSFVAPYLQELGQSKELLPEHITALGNLLQNTPLGQQIVAFRVWDLNGRVLYSTGEFATGEIFPMGSGLLRATRGMVSAEISDLEEAENAPLGITHARLLETYSPVRLSGTDRIIAVAEFYQTVDELQQEINLARQRSWLVVGASILIIYLLLSGFVRQASETIQAQQAELGHKVAQLTGLLEQNQELHERVRGAAARVATLNESILRRIGSELHDGPAQDLGYSLLKLDALIGSLEEQAPGGEVPPVVEQLAGIEASLQNALKEVRGIAAGLSLPQLAELSLAETAVRAVRAHERRSGTKVDLTIDPLPAKVPLPVKITLYRVLQEALNNSFRHAGGVGQRVEISLQQEELVLSVSDQGPGFERTPDDGLDGHLGLTGMRERVESLGGLFIIESQIDRGTRVTVRLPFHVERGDNGRER
jgi:signal transduction histidine kinase